MYTMNTTTEKVKGRILAGYKMYNTKELANLLQVSTVSVIKYIQSGKLKGQRIGRGYFASEEALKQFLGVE